MKIKSIIILVAIQTSLMNLVQAQEGNQTIINNNDFNTVFANIKSGKYTGTANGVLFFKDPAGKSVILDFQGSRSELVLNEDPDEIYDVSTKVYTAYTTSGKTKIEYQTYGLGNEFNIQYQNHFFSIGLLDGACDMIINGLVYTYVAEKETEYLILQVTKELKLANLLMENINGDKSMGDKEPFIFLQPKSVLVFATKRS